MVIDPIAVSKGAHYSLMDKLYQNAIRSIVTCLSIFNVFSLYIFIIKCYYRIKQDLMKFFVFFLLVTTSAIITACATLNKEECAQTNWQQLGDIDGQTGHPLTRLTRHSQACTKHNLPVNTAAYQQGWKAGITRFCTPQNGLQFGRSGRFYKDSCPSGLSDGFLATYRPAKRLFDAEVEIKYVRGQIDQRLDEIERLAGSPKPEDKEKLRRAKEDLGFLRNQLSFAWRNAKRAQHDLQTYLDTNPKI